MNSLAAIPWTQRRRCDKSPRRDVKTNQAIGLVVRDFAEGFKQLPVHPSEALHFGTSFNRWRRWMVQLFGGLVWCHCRASVLGSASMLS